MVKQGGSETAENDASKLVNVSHLGCQRSLPGRSDIPRGVSGIFAVFKRDQKLCPRTGSAIDREGVKISFVLHETW